MELSTPDAPGSRATQDALLLQVALMPRQTAADAQAGIARALELALTLKLASRASLWLMDAATPAGRYCLARVDGPRCEFMAAGEALPSNVTDPGAAEGGEPPAEHLRHTSIELPLSDGDTALGWLRVERDVALGELSPRERQGVEQLAQLMAQFVMAQQRELLTRRLERSAVLYRRVVDDQTDLIFRTDDQARIVFLNRAALEFAGLPQHEVIGKRVFDFAPKEERAFIAAENEAVTLENPVIRYEHHGVRADGVTVKLQWLIRGLFDEDGKVLEYQCIGRDITLEREREQRLQEAQRLESLAVLSGGIAHDFNNLLTPILGYSEVMLKHVPPEHKNHTRLGEIIKAARRAQQLVRQILVFGRKENGPMGLVEVSPEIRDTLDFLRASLPSHIELEVMVDSDLGQVNARPTDLYQIVSNLCTNAFQAMPAGGKLTVSATRITVRRNDLDQPYFQLIVRDTGTGIEPELSGRIFEPFFTTKHTGGTGLGLSTVHGRVTSLGGTIDVQSKVGEGTSFVVLLPNATRAARPSMVVGKSARHARGQLLVVDDEPPVAELMREMLEGFGYKVEARHSANEALALFMKDPEAISLVVTDLTMPRMSGVELAFRVHQVRPHTPVLLMTGFGELLTGEDLTSAQVLDVLKKPFDSEVVARAVSAALGSEQAKEAE